MIIKGQGIISRQLNKFFTYFELKKGSKKKVSGRTQYNIKNIKTRKTIRQGTFIHFKEQFEDVTRKIHRKYCQAQSLQSSSKSQNSNYSGLWLTLKA